MGKMRKRGNEDFCVKWGPFQQFSPHEEQILGGIRSDNLEHFSVMVNFGGHQLNTFLILHAAQSQNQPRFMYIVHKQTWNAPAQAVKEWFFQFPALFLHYNCHRVMIRVIMTVGLDFSLHLGQRGAHMGLVNGTWQDGGHCKGFITTIK